MDLRSLLNNAQSSFSSSYNNGLEGLIDRVGLERHRASSSDNILPAIGVFAAGLAVGAALGLIFAPKRGEELRDDLSDQVDHLKDRLDKLSAKSKRQYEDLVARGNELVESAKNKLPYGSEVREYAEDVAYKAERTAEKLAHKVEHAGDSAEHAAKKLGHKAEHLVEEVGEKAEHVIEKLKK